jgi:hypothetical protein
MSGAVERVVAKQFIDVAHQMLRASFAFATSLGSIVRIQVKRSRTACNVMPGSIAGPKGWIVAISAAECETYRPFRGNTGALCIRAKICSTSVWANSTCR